MISFVIPLFNEEESLEAFYQELLPVLPSLDPKYEIIFVDDGSKDNSLSILKSFADKDKHVRIFSFRRNLGKAEALTFGFSKAEGEYIVTLDADLQDQPSEIKKLLDKAKEGIDLVSGWRKNRQDTKNTVLSSKIFNSFVGIFLGLKLHDYNCGLKVYTSEAAKSLYLYGGMHRFIPLLVYQQGFTVTEMAVKHQERKFGQSKYAQGALKILQNLPDIFTMLFLAKFGKRPLHFFGVVGGIVFLIGLIIFLYLFGLRLEGQVIGRRPLFFTSILLISSGLQVLFTGFLADLMINIAHAPKLLDEGNLNFPLKYSTDKE